jgi:hypothetical protein
MRRALPLIALVGALLLPAVVYAGASSPRAVGGAVTCSAGYVDARLSWGEKCLRIGEFCKVGNSEYHQYGFDCPAGHLVDYAEGATTTTGTPVLVPVKTGAASSALGRTVLVAPRSKTTACRRSVLPDRRCSPGAYYSGLTKTVICSASFHTGTVRNVPDSEKFVDEREYGMVARHYGRTIEIDHIVSLELGGSNDIANLFPEPGSGAASYHIKDKLENRLHDMVCAGAISLRSAQQQIAANWEKLYAKVFGTAP